MSITAAMLIHKVGFFGLSTLFMRCLMLLSPNASTPERRFWRTDIPSSAAAYSLRASVSMSRITRSSQEISMSLTIRKNATHAIGLNQCIPSASIANGLMM